MLGRTTVTSRARLLHQINRLWDGTYDLEDHHDKSLSVYDILPPIRRRKKSQKEMNDMLKYFQILYGDLYGG